MTEWFDLGGNLQVDDTLSRGGAGRAHRAGAGAARCWRSHAGVRKHAGEPPLLASAVDFVLEGLYAQKKISRSDEGQFQAAEQAAPPAAAGGAAEPIDRRPPADREQEEVLQLRPTAERAEPQPVDHNL